MPNLYIIGGPNGAGKTTASLRLLPRFLNCREYVNADSIAAGLSPFHPESVAFQAGRLMLERLNTLAASGADFAFETTLASHPLPIIARCKNTGYEVTLFYFWLHSPELAIERVAQRVRTGGHAIPEETIRRRYETGRSRFLSHYVPLADNWRVYDNSHNTPLLIAHCDMKGRVIVHDRNVWAKIERTESDADRF